MKRTIIAAGALALAGGIFFMPGANARPACGEGDTVNLDIAIGSACAGGTAGGTGHVYVDGNSDEGNTNPEPLDGYIGANNDEEAGETGIVGCAEGDYQDDTDVPADRDNDPNQIWDPTTGQPPGAPDPNSPCAPSP